MDAPEFARRVGAPLFGSASTANIGRGAGLPEAQIRAVETGVPIRMGTFEVTFIESRHGPALFGRVPYPGQVREPLVPPAPASAYRLGETYTIVITHACGTVLYHGSAGFKEGESMGVRAGVVLLGIAGRDDTEVYLCKVVDPTGASRVIPIHFDNFFVPLTEPIQPLYRVKPAEFFRTAAEHRPALKVETLPLGTPVPLFP
jgi:L-ascorbate metabolism protein UlaG (beta-lactamase superfamily)